MPKRLALHRIDPVDIDVSEELKRPRLLAVLFCDYAIMSREEKPVLVGVFDRIFVDRLRQQTPRFGIYLRLAELEGGFTTTIIGPDNVAVAQFRSTIEEVDRKELELPKQVHTILGMELSVEKEGVYWVHVEHQGVSLGGAALPIHFREEGGQQGGTETYF